MQGCNQNLLPGGPRGSQGRKEGQANCKIISMYIIKYKWKIFH